MPTSRVHNFHFIEPIDEVLAKACADTEGAQIQGDLWAATVGAGAAAERILKLVSVREGCCSPNGPFPNNAALIMQLLHIGAIDRHLAGIFHGLREDRNLAMHELRVDTKRSKSSARLLHSVASWFAQKYFQRHAAEYSPVSSESQIVSDEPKNRMSQLAVEGSVDEILSAPVPSIVVSEKSTPDLEADANFRQTLLGLSQDDASTAENHLKSYVASSRGIDMLRDSPDKQSGDSRNGPKVPNTVAQRFTIQDRIGSGGIGEVFKATRLSDGKAVALKLLRRDMVSTSALERFRREAANIKALHHPNIVPFLEFVDHESTPVLVLEFIAGESLDKRLIRGPISEPNAVPIFRGICAAVGHAHKQGVIHRDIKPANVILDESGTPRLVDFGLARGADGLDLSMTGYGMGTFDFAAPEQKLDAKHVDRRADIYSLGATFYAMLTQKGPPLLVDKVPAHWRAFINRACDHEPGHRFASVEEMLVALSAPTAIDDLACPKCHGANSLDARLCVRCGAGLVDTCPSCFKGARHGVRKCKFCGAELDAAKTLKAHLDEESALSREGTTPLAKRLEHLKAALAIFQNSHTGHLKEKQATVREAADVLTVNIADASALRQAAMASEREFRWYDALERLQRAAAIDPIHREFLESVREPWTARRKLKSANRLERHKLYARALERLDEVLHHDPTLTSAVEEASARVVEQKSKWDAAESAIKYSTQTIHYGFDSWLPRTSKWFLRHLETIRGNLDTVSGTHLGKQASSVADSLKSFLRFRYWFWVAFGLHAVLFASLATMSLTDFNGVLLILVGVANTSIWLLIMRALAHKCADAKDDCIIACWPLLGIAESADTSFVEPEDSD